MTDAEKLKQLHNALLSRTQLRLSGVSDHRIRHAVLNGELIRIAPGNYIRNDTSVSLQATDQHLLRILALNRSSSTPPIYSHVSAAVLLGLPLFRFVPAPVHTLYPQTAAVRSTRTVTRHRGPYQDDDLDFSGNIWHTNLGRTLIDIARTGSFEQAVIMGDAALRRLVRRSGEPIERVRQRLYAQLAQLPRSKGSARAAQILRFIENTADSPLESLFRLQLCRLGFEVRTQVAVPAPRGSSYFLDFELVGHDVYLEADGRVKYEDPQMRRGLSAEQVVIAEKEREDWIRGTQNKRVLRAGWADATTMQATANRLRAFGVQIPIEQHPRQAVHLL